MAAPENNVLQKLRTNLATHGCGALRIPMNDAHMSEYVSSYDKRIQFVSNFSGSAGTILVTEDEAFLWTDGRYFVQAGEELPKDIGLMKQLEPGVPTMTEFLKKKNIDKVLCDPFLLSSTTEAEFKAQSIEFISPEQNPVDEAWTNQPPMPVNAVFEHELQFCGQSREDKLKVFREELVKKKCQASVVCALDQICWIMNLRGSDITYNPVFFAYLVITMDDVTLFINESKLTSELKHKLNCNIRPYRDILDGLHILSKSGVQKILLDPSSSNVAVKNAIPNELLTLTMNPIEQLKSIKNEVELEGMRQSHIRDGVAKTRWLYWLEQQMKNNADLTEYGVTKKLDEYRSQQEYWVSPSFGHISSTGANGAIIHYHPTEKQSSKIEKQMYLIDSGGQYFDGTTDVTRTTHFGEPSEFEIFAYTRVLQGHIGLATVVFPDHTCGPQLDPFARAPLWKSGLNFKHGTGHGVGCFLNVHEGPIGISSSRTRKKLYENDLKPGMILSNEPGYYEEGHFGIRIENLVIVKKVETPYSFATKTYCGFETITMIPLEKRLINVDLMNEEEIKWVNDYHEEVWTKIQDKMESEEERMWLRNMTTPLNTNILGKRKRTMSNGEDGDEKVIKKKK